MSDLRVVREFRARLLDAEPTSGRRLARPPRRALIAALAVLVLGSAIATAATGSLPIGDPIPSPWSDKDRKRHPDVAPLDGSGRLERVRTPDPDGGPPWGVRRFSTRSGLRCDQVGRVVDGRLGVIGDDGVFREAPLASYGCSGERGGGPERRPPADAGIYEYGGGGPATDASGAAQGAFSPHPCVAFGSVGARQSFDPRVVICDDRPRRWIHTGRTGPLVVAVELRGPGVDERYPVVDGRYLIVRRAPEPAGVIAYAVFRDGHRTREWSTPRDTKPPIRHEQRFADRTAPRAQPPTVDRRGQVVVALRAPRDAEPKYGDWYDVVVSGPPACPRQGTLRFVIQTGRRLKRGEPVRFAIRPPGPSADVPRAWCPGRYTGTLIFRGRIAAGGFFFNVR